LFPASLVVSIRRPVNDAVRLRLEQRRCLPRASHAALGLIVLLDTGSAILVLLIASSWPCLFGTHRPILTAAVVC